MDLSVLMGTVSDWGVVGELIWGVVVGGACLACVAVWWESVCHQRGEAFDG